jgi:NitT/TauT family transport system substrate-binding protein
LPIVRLRCNGAAEIDHFAEALTVFSCAFDHHVLFCARNCDRGGDEGGVTSALQGNDEMRLLNFAAAGRLAIAMAATGFSITDGSAQTAVKFSLDGRIEGPAAFFYLPLDRGYFKAEGLDVSIEAANTAVEPINRVATGGFDMAFADINALIRFRNQSASTIKAVFMVYNKPPYSIVARRSRGITVPKDLEHKRLGAPAAGATAPIWPLFAKVAGIDATKVTVENVGIPVREPMLAAGQVDAITGYAFNAYVNLKDRGVPASDIVLMQMPDYGLILYGAAVIVSAKFAAEKPEAVQAFLRALLRGLREVTRNPVGAVESILKRNEIAKRDVELERLRMAIRDNVLTPEVRARGFGAVDMGRLENSLTQTALAFTFKNKPKAADIFDSAFLPSLSDRKTN